MFIFAPQNTCLVYDRYTWVETIKNTINGNEYVLLYDTYLDKFISRKIYKFLTAKNDYICLDNKNIKISDFVSV